MLIYQTLLYLPAQLLGPLFQFIAAVVWTHWLAPDAYGVLAFVMAGQDLAFLVCLSWWSHYTMRYLGTFVGDSNRARYQKAENSILWFSSILQAGVCFFILAMLDTPLTPLLVCSAILFTVSRSISTHLGERARSRGQIAAYTVTQTIGPVFGFGLAYLAISQISASPTAALGGFAIAQVAGLIWLWRAMNLGVSVARPERAILKAALAFGMPLVISGAVGWVSVNGIRVIVEHFDGVQAVGLVSVGWALGQRVSSVVAMLVTAAAFPLAVKRFQAGAKEDALRQLSASGTLLLGLLAPSAAGLILLTVPLVDLLVAAPFREITIAVLPVAVVAGSVRNLRVHFGDQAYLLFERPNLTIIINAVEAIAVVVLCLVGLKIGGLPGASEGCLAGITVGAVFCFTLGRIKFGLPLPFADAARIFLATATMAVVLLSFPWSSLFKWPGAGLMLEVIIGAVVYGCMLAVLYPAIVRDGVRWLTARRSAVS